MGKKISQGAEKGECSCFGHGVKGHLSDTRAGLDPLGCVMGKLLADWSSGREPEGNLAGTRSFSATYFRHGNVTD